MVVDTLPVTLTREDVQEKPDRFDLRLLWKSNAIWAPQGYGTSSKYLLPKFMELGIDCAQFAFYGLQGAKLDMHLPEGTLKIYPMGWDVWGLDVVDAYVKDHQADLLVSMMDLWPLPPDYGEKLSCAWAPWFPVDHWPVSAEITERAKRAKYPINYSKWGQAQMREAGAECGYIPPGVDCNVFKPEPRAAARVKFGDTFPDGSFVIAMVGANKGVPSRKGYPEAAKMFKAFHDRHPEAILYIHAVDDRRSKGLDFRTMFSSIPGFPFEATRFPSQIGLSLGLDDKYMASLYNAADVLLQPSYCEGFGIPILEAQACGTPVIVNGCTAMPELCFSGQVVPIKQEIYYWLNMGGFVGVPDIDGFIEALEWAYDMSQGTEGQKWLRETARAGALDYDYSLIVENYWIPFFEKVEAELKHGE